MVYSRFELLLEFILWQAVWVDFDFLAVDKGNPQLSIL